MASKDFVVEVPRRKNGRCIAHAKTAKGREYADEWQSPHVFTVSRNALDGFLDGLRYEGLTYLRREVK
jgi:hypothetical protein